MRRFLLAGLAGLIALVLSTTSASAATLQIDDPDDDGARGARLDITSMTVRNNDFAIVMTVRFRKVTTGDMAIYFRAAGASQRTMVGVVSEHRARKDTNYLLTADGEKSCRGLKVTWDAEQDIAKVRLPSRCFNGGDYGRVQVRVITEIAGGSDIDLAPSTPAGAWPWSAPVARG